MKKGMIWGLVTLIILLIGVSVFLLLRNTETEPGSTVYKDVEPSKETMDSFRNQASKNNPPPAEPGYKWVWHHNHWDKVAVSEPEAPPGATPTSVGPFEPDDTWRIYPDNVWRKKGEQAIPRTLPPELKLPEDVFSEVYTERLKKLVQEYVQYHQAGDERSLIRGLNISVEIANSYVAIGNLFDFYTSDKTNNRYALERYEELNKLLEPYRALIPKSNRPNPFEKFGDPRERFGHLPSKSDLDAIRQRRSNQ